MPVDILSDDSDVEELDQLNINEHYAKAFEYRKEREELEKRASNERLSLDHLTDRHNSEGEVRLRRRRGRRGGGF